MYWMIDMMLKNINKRYHVNNIRVLMRCSSSSNSSSSSSSSKERQGFGSFHSDDIDVLTTMNDNEYQAMYQHGYPPIYHDVKEIIDNRFMSSISSSSSSSSSSLYGKDCKEKMFVLDDSWVISSSLTTMISSSSLSYIIDVHQPWCIWRSIRTIIIWI